MSLDEQVDLDTNESLDKLIVVELFSPNIISNELFNDQKKKSFKLINNSEPE